MTAFRSTYFLSAYLLTGLLVSAAPVAEVRDGEVRTVEVRTAEATVSGALVELSATEVVVRTVEGNGEGNVTLAHAQLSRITNTSRITPPTESPVASVRLVDGSSLACVKYTVEGDMASFTLRSGQSTRLPTKRIATVRFSGAATQENDEAWATIQKEEIESDVLVVRGEGRLDHLKGLLGELTDERVVFKLGERTFRVRREKVEGLIYFHAKTAGLSEAVCRVTLVGGSTLAVQGLKLTGNDLSLHGPTGLRIEVPWSHVVRLDFAQENVVYLSDLKPESVEWTPLLGEAKPSSILARASAPRNDRSLTGGPLRLGKTEYAKGLALRSQTRIVYRLPERFTRFKAVAGIDDAVRPRGHVRMKIMADEKKIFDEGLGGRDEPRPISLDISGARRLTILVEFGEDQDLADHLDLGNARFIK